MSRNETVLVTGGAGYVGSELVPMLLEKGYRVRVLDLFLFGEHVLDDVKERSGSALELRRGDIRDQTVVASALQGVDKVIHLACISNDPSFELDPDLSRTINFDAFGPLVKLSKSAGVRRFIYISSSSVYGVSDAPNVTEEHPLVPLTDYNKYKGLCEPILLAEQSPGFTTVVIRPATICGMSRRLRLDLSVNILTNYAVNKGFIKVFGGSQRRPNIHIVDVCDLYTQLLEIPDAKIAGQIFNASYENCSIADLATRVATVVGHEFPDRPPIRIETSPTNDLRSYHVSSEKIARELGFSPRHTIEDAVRDLCAAFRAGKIPNSFDDMSYFNVKSVQASALGSK
jgi:nucleoside-diphosphate-sugar epimerase